MASVRVYRSTVAGPLRPPGYPWGELICFFICLTDEFDMLSPYASTGLHRIEDRDGARRLRLVHCLRVGSEC
jgi:hypothetical protein